MIPHAESMFAYCELHPEDRIKVIKGVSAAILRAYRFKDRAWLIELLDLKAGLQKGGK